MARQPRSLLAALLIGAAVVLVAFGLALMLVVAMSMGGGDSAIVVPVLLAEVFIAGLAIALGRYGARLRRRTS